MITRRSVLERGALAAAPLVVPSRILGGRGKTSPSDTLIVGVIGVGGRGRLLIDQLPEAARVVAVADCWLTRCEEAAAKKQADWRLYQDYRRILDDKEIDAVIIATTDHGRVLPCIRACQAGKDVYAEKPLTLYVNEGRTLVKAVRKYKRVFQVGSQQRSMEMNRIASDFVRNGGLGKLQLVQGFNYPGPGIYDSPEDPMPEKLDWDMWLSQAPARPYSKKRHLSWMGDRDYSGGEMTNWGAHGLDQIQSALGMSLTGPVEFRPLDAGGKAPLAFRYANGIEVRLELTDSKFMGGALFTGEKGKIEIVRNNFRTDPARMITNLPPPEDVQKWRDEVALWQARYHMQDWIDCIHTREKPRADVEIGHRSISLAHLCNITRELGRTLRWDPKAERFVGDDQANRLLDRPRRKGYELPKV
jgi:predicted dehydrogenase